MNTDVQPKAGNNRSEHKEHKERRLPSSFPSVTYLCVLCVPLRLMAFSDFGFRTSFGFRISDFGF